MTDTLRREEDVPDAWPSLPGGLENKELAWSRVEAYIAYRWTARTVRWTVRGPGCWAPDLTPATITASERFVNSAWESVTLDASWSGGFVLPGDSIFRFTATVGDASPSDPPEDVQAALRRLDAYFAEAVERHGVGRYEADLGGVRESFDRSATWQARALQLSGAADLLRPYRRAP